jgi:DNA mismatch repair protein MutL
MSENVVRVLPEDVANKIAAGEVVERPASVLKELLENAIDAGATRMDIWVEAGGKKSIQVKDDGCGMNPDDALTAFDRHATSKISSAADLERILTLGFRGEALPSIASVARVELTTRQREAEGAVRIRIHGGRIIDVRDTGAPAGTSVIVRNLFYNVPARRKFLRSAELEFRRILDVVTKVGLVYPSRHMTLHRDDRRIFDLQAVQRKEDRIHILLGDTLFENLLPVRRHGAVDLFGYIGKPEFAGRYRSPRYLFVNDRPVRSRTVNSAIFKAYGSYLSKGTYPPYVLFMQVDSGHIDVNIHPSKQEVRFHNEGAIFREINDAVRETLAFSQSGTAAHVPPENPEKRSAPATGKLPKRAPGAGAIAASEKTDAFRPQQKGVDRTAQYELPAFRPSRATVSRILTYNSSYIVFQRGEDLILVDQHAAHERVLYEKFLATLTHNGVPSQRLVFSASIELSRSDAEVLRTNLEVFRKLGFDCTFDGSRTATIEGVPSIMGKEKPVDLFLSIIADLVDPEAARGEAALSREDAVIKSCACHSAVKAGQPLTEDEIISLLDDLFACRTPHACPHGRPTFIRISLNEVLRRFGRI